MTTEASHPSSGQTQREFIDYRFNEVNKKIDRIETKIDGLNGVTQDQFAEFRIYVDTQLAKKVDSETFDPYKRTLNLIASAIGLALVGAIMALLLRK